MPELHRSVHPLADLRARRALRRLIEQLEPDVVHTHSSKAGVLGRLAATAAGTPVVHTVHGWSFHDGQPRAVRRAVVELERYLAARTDRLVVVTDVDARLGLEAGIGRREQYRTVRSAVDIDGIAQRTADGSTVRHELGLDPSAFVVGSITRLASQKDPETLVTGFAAFAATAPDAVLVVVGDGPLAETIVVRVAELGLQDRVHLLGARGDAAGLLGAFDVFVSPARWEGLPRTVLEAAVAGVPIVTTPVGGVPEVVEHDRSGLLVEVGDSAGLGEALSVLHADPALRAHLANGARRRVGAEFDVTTMAERLVEVWGEVAGRPAELAGQHRAP